MVSPVAEGASGARALQMSSGCPRAVYWVGSLAWDLVMHLGVAALSLATFAAFGDVRVWLWACESGGGPG